MKTKKINQRLILCKHTIVNLNPIEMSVAKGGRAPEARNYDDYTLTPICQNLTYSPETVTVNAHVLTRLIQRKKKAVQRKQAGAKLILN